MQLIYTRSFFLSIICALAMGTLEAQPLPEPTILSGTITNEKGEILQFATVAVLNQSRGTITNEQGFFELRGLQLGDSIAAQMLGYQAYFFTYQGQENLAIQLKISAQVLNEVMVVADDDYLYNLIDKCKKKLGYEAYSSKCYMSLESYSVDSINPNKTKQIEMLEAYYNGAFNGPNLSELELKTGRFALLKFDKRFFNSTETSKAVLMHDLVKTNNHFPDQPLNMNARQLKKSYELNLIRSFYGSKGNILEIGFEPKEDDKTLFSGTLWMDENQNIQKIALYQANAKYHPFVPFGHIESLDTVDLNITKTFEIVNGKPQIQSITFNYELSYQTRQNEQRKLLSKAFIYAYNYKKLFQLPYFQFSNGLYKDYIQISALPYNSYFWDNSVEFTVGNQSSKNSLFYTRSSTLTSQDMFNTGKNPWQKGFFEKPYIQWSKDARLNMRANPEENEEGSPIPKCSIEAQMYLDITTVEEKTYAVSNSVYDPYHSLCNLSGDSISRTFINIYFDLVEIERRKMMKAIVDLTDSKLVDAQYEMTSKRAKAKTKKFKQEVDYGNKTKTLLKWNKYVYQELGIDNAYLQGLTSKPLK